MVFYSLIRTFARKACEAAHARQMKTRFLCSCKPQPCTKLTEKSMKKSILAFGIWLLAMSMSARGVSSPNGKLTVDVKDGRLTVCYQKQPVLEVQVEAKGEWSEVGRVTADYRMVAGKRLHCTNEANEYRSGDAVLRVYDDGIAIRGASVTYRIPEGTRRWMQQWCDSYEGFFPLSTTYKVEPVPSYSGISKSAEGWNNRWGYPALLESVKGKVKSEELDESVFVLLTEADIRRGHSASCLMNDGELFRVVPAETQPAADTPAPWRVAIVGTLADIVQSTLVTDVSEPSKLDDTGWIQPGVVSWIYWAYNHGSNDYGIIKKYVDMAAALRLPYVLIDAEWDEMDKVASNEGKTIEDAVAYAKSKGVKPLIWYNSSVGWVDGAPTPKFRLNKPEDREKEFAWCEKIGVAGVKIDFFSGDNQLNMDYCQDLLESAARHHLLVNFHGAPIPRGWQRTYPNLLSTEGVYGAEWYNNVPHFTKKAAAHNATLPFTRNVVGPMDYTPCAFSDSQHPHITSNAHELALTVLFESALQHLADRPESFLSQPQAVQHFLGRLPTVWDETRYVSGYPGQSAVLARRSGSTWYVAGINGTDEPKALTVPLDFLKGKKHTATLFADGETVINNKTTTLKTTDNPWAVSTVTKLPTVVPCKPRGGFVLVVGK